jgi:peroxiredoxin
MKVLATLVLAAVSASSTGLATVHYGAPPPADFAIPSAGGREHLADFRGKVVVIDFWATWCHVCTAEMRFFQRAKTVYGDRVEVVTVSNEFPDVAATYFHLWDVDLPLVEDPQGTIFKAYSVHPIPVTIVLGKDGDVSYVSVGGLSWEELSGAIDRDEALPVERAGTPAPRVLP